jgi:hypothetical protein
MVGWMDGWMDARMEGRKDNAGRCRKMLEGGKDGRTEGRNEGRKEGRKEDAGGREGRTHYLPAWRGSVYPSHPFRVASTIECTFFMYGDVRSPFASLSPGDEGSIDERGAGRKETDKGRKKDDGRKDAR